MTAILCGERNPPSTQRHAAFVSVAVIGGIFVTVAGRPFSCLLALLVSALRYDLDEGVG
jgi:hypothetical protein